MTLHTRQDSEASRLVLLEGFRKRGMSYAGVACPSCLEIDRPCNNYLNDDESSKK